MPARESGDDCDIEIESLVPRHYRDYRKTLLALEEGLINSSPSIWLGHSEDRFCAWRTFTVEALKDLKRNVKTSTVERAFNSVRLVLPIFSRRASRQPHGSGSSRITRLGTIKLGLPTSREMNILDFQENFVHESAHQCLYFIQHYDSLIDLRSYKEPVFSPIRNCKRPAISSLHAFFVVGHIMDFYTKGFLKAEIPEKKIKYLLKVKKLAEQFQRDIQKIELTKVGENLVAQTSDIIREGLKFE